MEINCLQTWLLLDSGCGVETDLCLGKIRKPTKSHEEYLNRLMSFSGLFICLISLIYKIYRAERHHFSDLLEIFIFLFVTV